MKTDDKHSASTRDLFRMGRFGTVLVAVLIFMVVSVLTRVALILTNLGEVTDSWSRWLPALVVGVLFDLMAGLWLLLPGTLFLVLIPERWLKVKVWQGLFRIGLFLYIYGLTYLAFVEWFFFDEFNARFNSVAVDYLIFPHEVFVNLWETYPIWQVLVLVGIIAVLSYAFLRRRFLQPLEQPTPWKLRGRIASGYILILVAGWFLVSPRLARVSDNRVLNEVALNGVYSFFNAAMTNELDYDAYYSRIDVRDAVAEVKRILTADGSMVVSPDDSLSIEHRISFTEPVRPLNVVLVLEESLGSRFVKSLSPDGPGVTPELERLADSGLLFTHIYATGNRTVRGMEAVLAGFPPIPGQSIVRRPGGQHIFTLPALLKSLGYSTVFVYGGYSYFDNMGDFALANGFDRVLDRTDLPDQTFTTIWGVCDEDLFNNSLHILDSLNRVGAPFFSLLLTVSNHSPFTFPAERLEPRYSKATRDNAVRYADFALGKFMTDAASHPFFKNTLFVVLGDHGARVYGSQQIPLESYRIPVLFYAPGIIAAGRNHTLASQLDVPSTIMGVLRYPYVSSFFGHDLLAAQNDTPRAFLSHNREVALFRNQRLAVLGLGQEEALWSIDSTTGAASRLSPETDPHLTRDAIAFYQTAYFLYQQRKLHPPERDSARVDTLAGAIRDN
jgi:phosphoglycerol transferase MdoB-like AlkP superfamily enzyme